MRRQQCRTRLQGIALCERHDAQRDEDDEHATASDRVEEADVSGTGKPGQYCPWVRHGIAAS